MRTFPYEMFTGSSGRYTIIGFGNGSASSHVAAPKEGAANSDRSLQDDSDCWLACRLAWISM